MKFKECVRQVSLEHAKALWLDVPTRWNSTYLMLERYLHYYNAFKILPTEDAHFLEEHLPTEEELQRFQKIHKFLKPFYDITTLFSGTNYPTANLYFDNVCKIHSNLLREIQCSDSCLKEMAQSMHVKFKKYWDEHCLVLAFVVILDPRFKIKFINFSLKKFDADHGNKSRSILDQLKKLFKEYEKVTFPNSAVATSANQDGAHDLDDNLMEFETFDSDGEFGSLSSSGKTQLEFYLSEPRVELTRASFDVLTFWRVNYCRYPELPMMARDILSIPITTVASESTFSIGGRVLNKWRSSLTCTNAQVLIATRNWLYGYEAFEDQKDNFEINGEEINLTTTVRSLSMASEAGSTFEEN